MTELIKKRIIADNIHNTGNDIEIQGISGGNGNALNVTMADSVDHNSGAINVVDYAHHEVHSGSHHFVDTVVDMTAGDYYDVQFTTPNSLSECHILFTVSSDAELEWWLYEDVTINNAGTDLVPRNNNRNNSPVVDDSGSTVDGILNTSLANANADTDVSGAQMLRHGKIGSGTGNNANAGQDSRGDETVFKQNTSYSLRVLAAGTQYVNFDLNWYEHTDRINKTKPT